VLDVEAHDVTAAAARADTRRRNVRSIVLAPRTRLDFTVDRITIALVELKAINEEKNS
jgi:hypothetical protein